MYIHSNGGGPLQCMWCVCVCVIPSGRPPPWGERLFQNIEWLMWPPPLNLIAFCMAITLPTSSEGMSRVLYTYMRELRSNWNYCTAWLPWL